jgi:hypothetical protein
MELGRARLSGRQRNRRKLTRPNPSYPPLALKALKKLAGRTLFAVPEKLARLFDGKGWADSHLCKELSLKFTQGFS